MTDKGILLLGGGTSDQVSNETLLKETVLNGVDVDVSKVKLKAQLFDTLSYFLSSLFCKCSMLHFMMAETGVQLITRNPRTQCSVSVSFSKVTLEEQ